MVKQDLIAKSAVRKLEQAIGGGIQAGEIGIIASKKGLGKTSILVQLGIDKLLQGSFVVHVSFNQQADYVISWYEDIFNEIVKKRHITKTKDIKNELISNRIVLNFSQESVKASQVIKTTKALAEGGSNPEAIIIDGFNFNKAENDSIHQIKEFAKKQNLVVWYSADIESKEQNFPKTLEPFLDSIDLILFLEPKPNCIAINVLKEHDKKEYPTDIKLDVKTLLLTEK